MRDISSWSIRNPIPVIMLFIMLTLGGVSGFNAMRINNNPDIDFPLIYVNASRPGAAPTEMETQVTRLIEDKIAGPERRAGTCARRFRTACRSRSSRFEITDCP